MSQRNGRPSRGACANPLPDDLLGLLQPVGHQVDARQCLVDGRIRLDLRLIERMQNRLGLGESADSRQGDGVKSLELALRVPERAGLVQLVGDFSEVAFLERDLREQGMCLSRAWLCPKPPHERLACLAVAARGDRQAGCAGCAAGCESALHLEGEKHRAADHRDRDCTPHDGPAARPICPNRSLDGQPLGDHGGDPLEPIVLG